MAGDVEHGWTEDGEAEDGNSYAPARSYARVARSNSTSFLEQRVSATRWKSNELKSHIPSAPSFQLGWLSKDVLDAIVRDYEAITDDPVRTPRKRDTIAACYRIHGADFLPFVADYFRVEGTAQNLLGVLRRAKPRVRATDEADPGDVLGREPDDVVPLGTSDAAAECTEIPCRSEECLQGLLYCDVHRPPYDPASRQRHDRHPSNPDAAPSYFDSRAGR